MKVTKMNKKWVLGIAAGVIIIVLAMVIAMYPKSDNSSSDVNANQTEVMQEAESSEDEQADNTESGDNESEETEEPLEKNANEAVNNTITEYLTACKNGDMDKIEKLVSTGDELTKEQVQKPYEYVEKIQNIDCYTLSGPDEGSYIVYVYYELKFVNVDTVAPGLLQLYLSTTSDDSLVIMLNELDGYVEAARDTALNRDDVKNLIQMVNTKLTEAANSDADLKELITKLNATEETAATATPKATEKAAATATPKATEKAAATATPNATEAATATATPQATKAAE